MKARLVAMLERTIVSIRDAIAALERDDVDTAVAKLTEISDRADETVADMRKDDA